MQAITTIGLDIAESVFQVHGIDAEGNVLKRITSEIGGCCIIPLLHAGYIGCGFNRSVQHSFLCNHAPDIAAMDLFVVPTFGFNLLYPELKCDIWHEVADEDVVVGALLYSLELQLFVDCLLQARRRFARGCGR